MSKKRIILSDSSLNRYRYRVLTSGLDIDGFKKNPVMLWAHFRDEGSPIWGNYLPIGYWDDIQINGDELSAIPVFDDVDELSRTIHAKYDAGTLRAASIGIAILATSAEKEYLLPGQTRETVTKAEVREASICDIPANGNAVRLYDRSTSAILAAGMDTQIVPELSSKTNHSMKFKEGWISLLSFLGIDQANLNSAELSVDDVEKVNGELSRLSTENTTLKTDKQTLTGQLAEKDQEITTLKTTGEQKDQEITTLKTSSEQKDQEIATLKLQVANLKANPAGKDGVIVPKGENNGEDKEDLAAFSDKNAGNHAAIAEEILRSGLY